MHKWESKRMRERERERERERCIETHLQFIFCSARPGKAIIGNPADMLSRIEFQPQWDRKAPVEGWFRMRSWGAHVVTTIPLSLVRSKNPAVILIDVVSRIRRGLRVLVAIDFREGIGAVVAHLVADIVWWSAGLVYGKLDRLLSIGKVVHLPPGLEQSPLCNSRNLWARLCRVLRKSLIGKVTYPRTEQCSHQALRGCHPHQLWHPLGWRKRGATVRDRLESLLVPGIQGSILNQTWLHATHSGKKLEAKIWSWLEVEMIGHLAGFIEGGQDICLKLAECVI